MLENTLKENHLIKGELLLDDNAVMEVLQVEKQLWSVIIKDDNILEVEVHKPNTKSQNSTCECDVFAVEKSCAHIACALLHLRNLNQKAQKEKKKKQEEKASQRFNIKTILDQIEPEILGNFVRSYAQIDKRFSTMIKATFASQIDVADNAYKYHSILHNLVKPIATEKHKSSAGDLRVALKVIEEFNEQIEDLLVSYKYDEAISILRSTIPKLHYMFAKYSIRTEKLVKWINVYHNHIDHLYAQNLAPKMTNLLDDIVCSIIEKSYYCFLDGVNDLYFILKTKERNEVLKEALPFIMEKVDSLMPEHNKTVVNAIVTLEKGTIDSAINEDDLSRSIYYLLKQGYTNEAVAFLHKYTTDNPQKRKIQYVYLNALFSNNKMEEYIKIASSLISKNNDYRLYKNVKEKLGTKLWNEHKSSILTQVSQHSNPNFQASVWYNEEMMERLLKVLDQSSDLRLIMKYDNDLQKEHYKQLETIYKKSIESYLESHVGRMANNFIEEVFYHLKSIKAYKLERSISTFIQNKFPHRAQLTSFK